MRQTRPLNHLLLLAALVAFATQSVAQQPALTVYEMSIRARNENGSSIGMNGTSPSILEGGPGAVTSTYPFDGYVSARALPNAVFFFARGSNSNLVPDTTTYSAEVRGKVFVPGSQLQFSPNVQAIINTNEYWFVVFDKGPVSFVESGFISVGPPPGSSITDPWTLSKIGISAPAVPTEVVPEDNIKRSPATDEDRIVGENVTGFQLAAEDGLPVSGTFGKTSPIYFAPVTTGTVLPGPVDPLVPFDVILSANLDPKFASFSIPLTSASWLSSVDVTFELPTVAGLTATLPDFTTVTLQKGGTLNFANYNPGGVGAFRVQGFAPESVLVNTDTLPFLHGLTFTQEGTVFLRQYQAIPEASSFVMAGLASLAIGGWRIARRRRMKNADEMA